MRAAMKKAQLLLKDKEPFTKTAARCQYFGSCGGCSLQDLSYEDQLALKKQRLLRILGELDPSLTIDIVPMDDPWRYRNKAELTFSDTPPRRDPSSGVVPETPVDRDALRLGYHAARSFWRIVSIDDCWLLPEPMSALFRDARELAKQTGLPPYNPKTHQGIFRYLTVRGSRATGQLLVLLLTADAKREVIETLADELMRRHPQISSFYWGVNRKVADIAIPDELQLVRGTPFLSDRLGPFSIKLHPLNFLQPNPVQAERLYTQLTHWLSDIPTQVAWDLYCGVGLVSFYLSSKCRKVYGIDIDAGNLELAQQNAADNGITNVEFRHGPAEELLANKRFWLTEAAPSIIVVDPPRSGLHPRVVASLQAARPKQIVYVSCNAQSLARDLKPLMSDFPRYRLCQARAFDLFPHTNHLEILTLLERA